MGSTERRFAIPASLEVRHEPRAPEKDPTLGIPVAVDRGATPTHRLVTIGDSLTQGFMSGAVCRTDVSWPAIVAHELGAPRGPDGRVPPLAERFHYPTYEAIDGPGGLPFDLERAARRFELRFGTSLDWHEIVSALRWAQRTLDGIEDYWERGPGASLPTSERTYHNLGIYGWDPLEAYAVDADLVAERLTAPAKDNWLRQLPDRDNDRAARRVLESCRAPDGTARTVVQAARAMGEDGAGPGAGLGAGDGPGIETLVVMLGANNALSAVVNLEPCWTPDDYLDLTTSERLHRQRRDGTILDGYRVWQPAHFAAEWAELVAELRQVRARHVVVATVPQVTIAPIARGILGKARPGSRYFRYYTRPWISADDFDLNLDPHLTEDEVRAIDSAVDQFNETIIDSVRAARRDGLDWYVLELGGALDRLASRRYLEDPAARPPWWEPYPLPGALACLEPPPDTRFFRSGPAGRVEGGLFSLDGVHPTTSAYGIVAEELIAILDGAGVCFYDERGQARPSGSVHVDFERVLSHDTLLTRPPAAVTSTLGLLGWLDERVDWVRRLLPGG